jgi:polyisoprenoid-binding protein YceI
MVGQMSRTRQQPTMPARKRHWLRWVAAGLATVLVLAFAGTYAFIHFLAGAVPAPLTLPKLTSAQAGTGSAPIDGTWAAGKGSLAGYRVQEEFLGPGNSLVARTTGVTGKVVIAHRDLSAASIRIDLTTVTANGKPQPQLAKILDTARFPVATFTLTRPVVLGPGPAMNQTFRVQAAGVLTMDGITRPVTFEATARYSGSLLEAAGSIPVLFSDWNIHTPQFLQNHGLLEFLLVLRH